MQEQFDNHNPAAGTDSQRLRRLKREAQQARQAAETDDLQVYTIDNVSSDHTLWHVTVIPPKTSLYYGGRFKLLLRFSPEHPVKPPTVQFETKIFHPNVDPGSSSMHLAATGAEWCPVQTGNSLLRTIIADLDCPVFKTWKVEETTPEGESELREENYIANREAAELWTEDRDAFEARVAEWLVAYAIFDD